MATALISLRVIVSGEIEELAARLEDMRRGADMEPHDYRPDLCWRCDATESTTDVGLCDTCRTDLTGGSLSPGT